MSEEIDTGNEVEESASTQEPANQANEPWFAKAGLSEDLLKDEKFKNHLSRYDGLESALKGGLETKQKLSQKQEGMLKVPGEDATDEDRAAFFNSLGRPESADKYSWKPEEGTGVDPEIFNERMGALHKAGLTDQQHSAVMDLYQQEITRMNEDFQNHQNTLANETEAALKKEWGKDYQANVDAAKSAVSKDFLEILKETGVINHYKVIKELREIALSKREDGIDKGNTTKLSPQEELEQIKKNPAWNNKADAQHRELVKRSVELRAMI